MDIPTSKATSAAIVGIYRLLLFVFVIGLLYYGQYILTPLALAGLFTFMLSPLVTFLEKKLSRIVAVLIVISMFGIFIGLVGYTITEQVVEFSEQLPKYKANIESKLNSLNLPQNKSFTEILDTVQNLKNRLPGYPTKVVAKGPSVSIIQSSSVDLTSYLKGIFASLLNIIGSTGFVFLLVIFMLFAREDLRGRFIRLIGPRRITATTRAMNDAGYRVTHYLMMQFFLNIVFGFFVAIGLYFLGIPNAVLWGGLAAILRFIPFFGVLIGAMLPVVVALAISTHWSTPIFTFLLFIILDFIAGHILEPLLSGPATGISSLALIVSAVFWTLLWGPIGLLLSTPLTVCIVVMGRHIPKLAFLSVLLGNEEALALYEECYQRLIAIEVSEVTALINNHLKSNALTNVFDSIFIPILSAAETDRRDEMLEEDQVAFLHQNIQDILLDIRNQQELIVISPAKIVSPDPILNADNELKAEFKVLCVPASSEREELASIMLMEILIRLSFKADVLNKYQKEDVLECILNNEYDAICISLVAPYPIAQTRSLCLALRNSFPNGKIILGLWGMLDANLNIEKRLKSNKADSVVSSLAEAVAELDKFRLIKTKISAPEDKPV